MSNPTEPRDLQIPVQLKVLDGVAEELEEASKRLLERLVSVMNTTSMPDGGPDDIPSPSAPLANQVHEISERIDAVVSRLLYIIERLEI